ncbi:hypothetical protein WJX74_002718 [Apatococcus lobatus]|uniref:Cysteine-rich PDZ-binding protein n=1 Tax=Apatococcus lobatus TaxID=904363 RepID=A0AAW1R3B6_9CHLO
MVCGKCEKKLSKVICPDPYKEGARNTTEGGGRKLNENKLLSKKNRWSPLAAKCTVCKSTLHQQGQFCQSCAYQKGVCAMCGKQILDTKNYKQSSR